MANAFQVTNLVSDQAGVAQINDPNLVNAWGIALGPTGGNFWVSAEDADRSMVYSGDVNGSPFTKNPLEVAIPGGEPTGQVFNGTSDFVVHSGTQSGPAIFIFASETGKITGWNPNVGGPAPSTTAIAAASAPGAIYKGLALAHSARGNTLYAADFHNNKIDVYDKDFHRVHLAGAFRDPRLPANYAPFNIIPYGSNRLIVSYAQQDAEKEDDVRGLGHGFIDLFDTNGNLLRRIASRGVLNSPWGMTVAPPDFGAFPGALLVGNFGNGVINAFNVNTGNLLGRLNGPDGVHPIHIDGLWGLKFGNGVTAGDSNSLYFSAGPEDEEHGLFGKIVKKATGTTVTGLGNLQGIPGTGTVTTLLTKLPDKVADTAVEIVSSAQAAARSAVGGAISDATRSEVTEAAIRALFARLGEDKVDRLIEVIALIRARHRK
jgi:uncharacterized protein (TIGR03118 family)